MLLTNKMLQYIQGKKNKQEECQYNNQFSWRPATLLFLDIIIESVQ